ncbi:transcriptional pleiotropic regulator of transition state genes [Halobacillus karajensis]|uniref:AbrB/MazE/SpoVT family DNA-binding domain-containing protein n=1 Tax=Halobacillus karajensis TaxID=195088 RepID=UPI0008A7FC3D|nr:AbrB/MazE/SpoVT family DNA-binding domain-containing protein [Halobacillus karajensis]SEH77793.1 transcriptional pleiotropic regulator of transition state genes [Halobacillus karajensis]
MKSTGIVRKVDELGRVVIPKELRRNLEIYEKDPVEIYVEDDKVILKKYISSEEKAASDREIKKLVKYCDDLKIRVGPAQKEHLEQIQSHLLK